jgi:PleD family two-component response regulator
MHAKFWADRPPSWPAMPQLQRPLILVAEDEPNLREVLVFQLSASGFRVTEASNGREALRFRRAPWRGSSSGGA